MNAMKDSTIMAEQKDKDGRKILLRGNDLFHVPGVFRYWQHGYRFPGGVPRPALEDAYAKVLEQAEDGITHRSHPDIWTLVEQVGDFLEQGFEEDNRKVFVRQLADGYNIDQATAALILEDGERVTIELREEANEVLITITEEEE